MSDLHRELLHENVKSALNLIYTHSRFIVQLLQMENEKEPIGRMARETALKAMESIIEIACMAIQDMKDDYALDEGQPE